MPDRNSFPGRPALHSVQDPIVREHLRKIWEHAESAAGHVGDDRFATRPELEDVRRMLPQDEARSSGYRTTTLGGGDAGPPAAAASGGGVVDATYVLMSHDARLAQHRKLTAGAGYSIDDGGAGSTARLNARMTDVLGDRFVRWCQPSNSGGASIHTAGVGATVGTVIAITASKVGQIIRQSWEVPAIANSVHNARFVTQAASSDTYWRGTGGLGGFYIRVVFGVESVSANLHWCVGMRTNGTTALLAAQVISDLTDVVMIGCDTGDTDISIMCNDSAGSCTKTTLGPSFPAATAGEVYTFDLYCSASASSIGYRLSRLGGSVVTGTLTSNIPAAATFLTCFEFTCNGASAVKSGLSFMYAGIDLPYMPEEA